MTKSPQAELLVSAFAPSDFPRAEAPEVAFVGRSNVGKSSLLNRIAGVKRLAFVSKTPGRTQMVNFFRLGKDMVLVDLPGYGFAKAPVQVRRNWEELVTSYLFEREALALVLLLVDIRREPVASDLKVRDLIAEAGLAYAVVATKADKLGKSRAAASLRRLRETYGAGGEVPVVPFSAVTSEGRKELWKVIEKHVREARRAPKS
jgi:GTP-binding protein